MNTNQLSLALANRDRGLRRVTAANATFVETMRAVARMIARKQGTVTADDVRDYLADHPELGQPTHYNAFGAIFAKHEDFEFVGYVKSRQPQGHGNLINKANVLGLRKSAAYLASAHACRRRGDIGEAYRFKPGHAPHNKGQKGWQAGGRAGQTQFKKGQINGRAAELYKPIGTERINDEGYRERKVSDTGREGGEGSAVMGQTQNAPTTSVATLCKHCGNKIEKPRKGKEYCSPKCRYAQWDQDHPRMVRWK